MIKRRYLLFFFSLMALGALLTFSEVKAVTPTEVFTSVNPIPPRTCSTGAVTIVAGKDEDPTATFPRIVSCPGLDCPSETLTGQFLQWDYTFSSPNAAVSALYLSVSDDTSVRMMSSSDLPQTIPNCLTNSNSEDDGTTNFNCDEHTLRFVPSNTSTTSTSVYFLTTLGLSARIATAGVLLTGNSEDHSSHIKSFCRIAGASNPDATNQPTAVNQAIVQSQVVSTPGCNVTLTRDTNGRVADAVITQDFSTTPDTTNCNIVKSPAPFTCDNPLDTDTCHQVVSDYNDGLTTQGSCNYSYTNTIGGKTTIACTGCCVQPSTNKCVVKTGGVCPL